MCDWGRRRLHADLRRLTRRPLGRGGVGPSPSLHLAGRGAARAGRGWPSPSLRLAGRGGRSGGEGLALLLRSVSPVPTAREARRPATAAESLARRVWSCLRDILTALRRRANPSPPSLTRTNRAACYGRRGETVGMEGPSGHTHCASEKGHPLPALAHANQSRGLLRPPRRDRGHGIARPAAADAPGAPRPGARPCSRRDPGRASARAATRTRLILFVPPSLVAPPVLPRWLLDHHSTTYACRAGRPRPDATKVRTECDQDRERKNY